MVIDRLGEIVGIYWGSNPREKYGYSHILNYPGVYNVLAQCPFL
jgi:hypothetical protein